MEHMTSINPTIHLSINPVLHHSITPSSQISRTFHESGVLNLRDFDRQVYQQLANAPSQAEGLIFLFLSAQDVVTSEVTDQL
jgi:hypothetical protein